MIFQTRPPRFISQRERYVLFMLEVYLAADCSLVCAPDHTFTPALTHPPACRRAPSKSSRQKLKSRTFCAAYKSLKLCPRSLTLGCELGCKSGYKFDSY